METILATAFGRQVEVLKGDSDIIVDSVKGYLSSTNENSLLCPTNILPLLSTFLLLPACMTLIMHII